MRMKLFDRLNNAIFDIWRSLIISAALLHIAAMNYSEYLWVNNHNLRDHSQILILILSEFKIVNFYFPLTHQKMAKWLSVHLQTKWL